MYLFAETYPAVVNYTRMNFKMFIIQRCLLLENIKVKYKELVQPTTGHMGITG